jgi:CubicO group peptidase (beta-lactamase class C family)
VSREMSDPIATVADKLEAKAARFVKEKRLPGAAVGVVHEDELAWSAGMGFADVTAGRASDATTLYRIASITKTFTGTAIMQLRDEGRLDLDDPIVVHLPELRDASGSLGPIEPVTIRRALSHESGLMSEPPGTDWALLRYEGLAERNLARAAEIGTRVPPNSQWKYSNLGYQLLGEIVARVSGTPYVEYLRTQILEPLGLSSTAFEPLPDGLLARRAVGYGPRWFSDELEPAPAMPGVWAEGGLWSCVEDLARWLSFQFRVDAGPRAGAQILAGSTLREMHRPRYLVDDAWTEAWAIAWYADRKGDVVWVQHSGGLPGFITNACFDPKERVGAIALLNGVANAEELAMDLAGTARTAVREAAPTIEAPTATREAYRTLLGMYVSIQGGDLIRLEWRDGKLMFVMPDDPVWRPSISPTDDPDVFTVDPGFRPSGEPATFGRTEDGRVRTLFLGGETWSRLDPVRDR